MARTPKPHVHKINKALASGFVKPTKRTKRVDYIEFDFGDHILRLYKDANGDYTIPLTLWK